MFDSHDVSARYSGGISRSCRIIILILIKRKLKKQRLEYFGPILRTKDPDISDAENHSFQFVSIQYFTIYLLINCAGVFITRDFKQYHHVPILIEYAVEQSEILTSVDYNVAENN